MDGHTQIIGEFTGNRILRINILIQAGKTVSFIPYEIDTAIHLNWMFQIVGTWNTMNLSPILMKIR